MSTNDLLDFLRARLDEDERVARAAITDDGGQDGGFEDAQRLTDGTVLPRFGLAAADLISAFAVPRRVLREVEAKRRLLEQFRLRGDSVRRTTRPSSGGVWDDLLRMLALPYSDHPDCRVEWRP